MGAQFARLSRYNPEQRAPELSLQAQPHSYSDEEVLLYIRSVQLDQFEFPVELVLHIANFISNNRLRGVISLASKWLFTNFWASVSHYTDYPLLEPRQHPARVATQSYALSKLASVEKLTILELDTRYEDAILAAICRCAPRLRRLFFVPSDLEPYDRFILADTLFGVPFPRLQELNARGLSYTAFEDLLERAKHLKHITFPDAYPLRRFAMNTESGVPELASVTCSYSVMFDELKVFKSVKSLRKITVCPSQAAVLHYCNVLAEHDTNKLLSEYKLLRQKIDNACAHPDVEFFLDLTEDELYTANIYNLILSSKNQALIQILLEDATLSQHQIDLMFREFLVHSAHNYDYYDELMFIVDFFLKKDVDLSTPVRVPSLGITQTPFELLFRHCASMKLIKSMFFDPIDMPSLSSEPLTRFQIVRKQNPDYPFFWAQSLYFSCATGLSDPNNIIEVLHYFESDPSDLVRVTAGAFNIGSAFKANHMEFFPIHQVKHAQVAEHLLELGVDQFAPDSCHRWPAIAYAALRSADLLRVFTKRLEAQSPFVFNHESGMTIFDFVCQDTRHMKAEVLNILLDIGQRPTEHSFGGILNFFANNETNRSEEDFNAGLRAASECPQIPKMRLFLLVIFDFVTLTTSFPSDGEFETIRKRLAALLDTWMNAHEGNADRVIDSLYKLESFISSSQMGRNAPVAYLMCVFALPTQFARLVSFGRNSKDQRQKFDSIVSDWKKAHLFSSMTHLSSLNLGHIKQYFLVASILTELNILNVSSFDAHVLDFLPNPIAIELWRGYLASLGFAPAS